MLFIPAGEIQTGMRLAKPIYNKNGVLLYERNSPLTTQSINSIQNFGLIGIYILEPAEPLPPLSKEDLEFEQNQTVYMFHLKECFNAIQKNKSIDSFSGIITDIIKKYGILNHRINFNQNLRSADDFVYKHAISSAILTAMISHSLGLSPKQQEMVINAALLCGFGYIFVPRNIMEKGNELEKGEMDIVQQSLERGLFFLEPYTEAFDLIKNYIYQGNSFQKATTNNDEILNLQCDILKVANHYDNITGMILGHTPESEIVAMKKLSEHPEEFNPVVVKALASCIHIIPEGASVDLSTGDKGIVLAENTNDYLKPLILRLSDNQLYDLSNPVISNHMHIIDIMKTMDNRIQIDEETLKHFSADVHIKEVADRFRKVLYNK